MTTIALSGYIPFITMRILTHQETIGEKFKKYSLLSILLCWVVPLIISITMYIIDIRLEPLDPKKKSTFQSNYIKIMTYLIYFVICVILEFIYWELELKLRALMKEAEKKTRGKHKEKCILQFKRFHIVNVANLIWQLFTVGIAFNVFHFGDELLSTMKNIIRLGITVFFFSFVAILCMTKDRMKDLCKFLTCKLDQVDEQETPDELFNENDNDSLM